MNELEMTLEESSAGVCSNTVLANAKADSHAMEKVKLEAAEKLKQEDQEETQDNQLTSKTRGGFHKLMQT